MIAKVPGPSVGLAKIALTPGEPAGIGPDISIILAHHELDISLAVIADKKMLGERAAMLGIDLELVTYQQQPHQVGRLCIIDNSCLSNVTAGQLNPKNSQYVLDCINQAVDGCLIDRFDAMVTGPVHKGVINDAGVDFSGHTEWIAQRIGGLKPVMMLASEQMRVALQTTHLPLSEVPHQITVDQIQHVVRVLHADLKRLYNIPSPVIGVCGLNPHAGENGHMGREEIEIIEPALHALQGEGIRTVGPIPADSAFTPHQLGRVDVILAMYHDQGLPPIKHSNFGQVVNVTLGLPLIRTSVDHGTALHLAASGKVNGNSLLHAIGLARRFTLTDSHRAPSS